MNTEDGSQLEVQVEGQTAEPARANKDLRIKVAERKQAEEALRESEERYRAIFEQAADSVVLIDPETGTLVEFNDRAHENLGYTREEFQKLKIPDFEVIESAEEVAKHFEKIVKEGAGTFETKHRTKGGEIRSIQVSARAISIRGKDLIQAIWRDITERKRAEEALAQRATQLAILNDIGGKVAAALELEGVLDRAARLVQEGFGYHHVAIFTLDRERGELAMRTTAGAFTDLFPPDHRLKLGQGVVGWVGLYGEKVVANDVDVEPHYVNLYPDLIPTQSELSVPIRVGNEIVGVLDVQSPQFNAFDQNDVMAMETLADQIAVAIKNAWLFEESQRQVQELAGLYDTALATSSALEIEVLLSHLYNQVQQLMAPDTLVVVLHDAEAEGYRVALAVEEGETVPGAVGMRVALKEGGLTGWVIRERESLLVGDLEVDPLPVEPRHGARPARAWLGVPLIVRDRLLGAISVQSFQPQAFEDADRRFLESVAAQVATAIENARLYEAVQGELAERERAEKALRESERRFRDLFEGLPVSCWTFDRDGIIFHWNRACQELYGWTAEQVVGKTMYDLMVKDENVALTQEKIAAVFQGQSFYGLEYQDLRADGTMCDVLVSKYPLRDASGQVIMGICAELDITDRKRAEQEVRRRAEMLAALHETALDLAAQRSLPDLLRAIANRATNLLKARRGGIYLYRPATDDLELVISDPTSDFVGDALQRGQGLSGKVLETGQPIAVDDYSRWEGRTAQHDAGDLTACVSVPISWGDRLLGVLYMVDDAPRTFSADDIALLERLTPLAAAALEQTRLLQEARARWREAETLHQAGAVVTEILSLDETLVRILEQLDRVVPYDSASILLLREDCIEIVSGRGFPDAGAVIGLTFPVPGDNPSTEVVESRQPLILTDTWVTHAAFRESPHNHIRSWLGVPLIIRDRVIGMLAVDSIELGHFSQKHVRLVTPFANQAAIAIENARLVEGLEAEVAARTAEIRAEQEKSETILRSVGDAIAMVDLDMRIQYVNDAFTTLTGYTAEEALGQQIRSLMGGEMPELDRQSLQPAWARGEPWQGEVIHRRKDGRSYDAALTTAPMRDAEGRLTGYVSSHHDISRPKELERARSRFMTNVSHELRTPVANIKLYANLLQMGRRPEKTERYAQVLEEQADRLTELIRDILEMTSLDSGQAVRTWKPISLSTLIDEVATRHQGHAEASGLTLTVMPLPSGLPSVNGDHVRLNQALGELVENAISFTPAGGHVIVNAGTAEADDQLWVTVAVRDTGPGISPEEQRQVFDRFYRGSLAESGHIPGTGLGLSIVEEIMRAHGGRATVESTLDQGSTFTLWLWPGSAERLRRVSNPAEELSSVKG